MDPRRIVGSGLAAPPLALSQRVEGNGRLERLASRVHVEQYYPTESATGYSTFFFRLLIVLMAIALITTVSLGIVLAFRTSRNKWPVWFSLGLGIALPVILLWLGQKHD